MIVAIFGHSFIFNIEKVKERLKKAIINLISLGYDTFLVGYHGDFDKLALGTLRDLKKKYNIKITLIVTSKNFFVKKNKNDYVMAHNYNDVEICTYPIEDYYFKQQIIINNRFMVNDCDLVLAYVDESKYRSGARKTVKYAKKINKKIFNIYEKTDNRFYGLSKEEINILFQQFLEENF